MVNPVQLLAFSKSTKLPMIRQTELAECGLACIAMVSSYHGHKIDLNTLRRHHSISQKGTTLKTIMAIANGMNFSTRALRLELNELDGMQTPCILHWDLNHFVVLRKVKKRSVIIHDPVKGSLELTKAEASKSFTGVVLELTPVHGFEKKDEELTMPISSLWGRLVGLKRILVQIFLLSLLVQLFVLVSPFYIQLVVDNVVVGHDLQLLYVLTIGFLLLVFVRVGTDVLRSLIIMYLGSQLSIQMAANLFRHLLRLPFSYFEKRHIGDVVSRFGSMDKVKNLITTGLIEAIIDGIMAIGTLIMMFIFSPLLGGVALGIVSVYLTLRCSLYKSFKNAQEDSIIAHANENSNFMETVRATQCIKIFGREAQRQSVWHNFYAMAMNSDIRVNKFKITYKGINDLLFGMGNVMIIFFGATLVFESTLSVGMLFAFLVYKDQFVIKSTAIIEKFIEFKMLSLHLSRIADIALTKQEEPDQTLVNNAGAIKGELKLVDLSFKYADAEPYIYRKINFTFRAGESIAIVGRSGCGKTTLMKNMLGLLPPSEGAILCDGIDIRKYGLSHYRNFVGAVMQDDSLLSGSIMDNIAFFDPEMNENRVIECAKIASIHKEIMAMAMGYNTLIGDMGTTLSGGQKQRILLARALYNEPKILLMDEGTSALDIKLEALINSAVKQLEMTRIIIAHRKETIQSADRVVCLTNQGLGPVNTK